MQLPERCSEIETPVGKDAADIRATLERRKADMKTEQVQQQQIAQLVRNCRLSEAIRSVLVGRGNLAGKDTCIGGSKALDSVRRCRGARG